MQDEAKRAQIKRPIASAYQLSILIKFESFVDSTTAAFVTWLDELATNLKQPVDFGAWLQYYAFDVIGKLTSYLDFLKQGGTS